MFKWLKKKKPKPRTPKSKDDRSGPIIDEYSQLKEETSVEFDMAVLVFTDLMCEVNPSINRNATFELLYGAFKDGLTRDSAVYYGKKIRQTIGSPSTSTKQ